MPRKMLVWVALLATASLSIASAAPIFNLTPGGLVGGNRQWLATITPDASLFSGSPAGGSIATEVGFTVNIGSLVNITKNAANFPSDNPGNPISGFPFTASDYFNGGAQKSGNYAIAFLGSTIFTSATPQQFVTITTLGSGPAKISWLGAYVGNGRIAQGGNNYDIYSGMVSIAPEPASFVLATIGLVPVGAISRRRRII